MTQPNVLFITVDQWRGDCLSAAGHPVVRTPSLDQLATRGVRFANHWTVTAPCGPSRASLLTGMYLMQHRSVNNGTPLGHRFTNIALQARSVGYDPCLFGYTDTTVDPTQISDPTDPRLFTYEGVLAGFTSELQMATVSPMPWVEWLRAQGVDIPDDPSLSWGSTILATVIAFGIGLAVIHWLLKYVSKHSFAIFVWYRLALAAVVTGLLLGGVLQP